MDRPTALHDADTAPPQFVPKPRASDAIGESLRQAFRPRSSAMEMSDLLARLDRIA
ncbi:hypothetical protein [uncultured Sphingomonas sp.]|uniref:hypothetical protein n=1 Tax=uncultured Sphingomonas sp. TaxID=158754 RepID=UPI00260737B0|nr:hypothetical protein [uncultured Sphingomonas sp.]